MSGGLEESPGQEYIRVHGYNIRVGSELAWSDVWYMTQLHHFQMLHCLLLAIFFDIFA